MSIIKTKILEKLYLSTALGLCTSECIIYRQLFDLDFIKDKKSNKLLESIGGYQGLKERLKTDLQVYSSFTLERHRRQY